MKIKHLEANRRGNSGDKYSQDKTWYPGWDTEKKKNIDRNTNKIQINSTLLNSNVPMIVS